MLEATTGVGIVGTFRFDGYSSKDFTGDDGKVHTVRYVYLINPEHGDKFSCTTPLGPAVLDGLRGARIRGELRIADEKNDEGRYRTRIRLVDAVALSGLNTALREDAAVAV